MLEVGGERKWYKLVILENRQVELSGGPTGPLRLVIIIVKLDQLFSFYATYFPYFSTFFFKGCNSVIVSEKHWIFSVSILPSTSPFTISFPYSSAPEEN